MRVTLDRALVLRQPWAQATVEGAFPVLLRSITTNIRGWVGILAAKNPDPAGFHVEEDLPRQAIVGAVEIGECFALKGDPRTFLADTFGGEVAKFYPDHFLPTDGEKHVWVLERALPAASHREWDGTVPRTWATCNTWIEGDPVLLAELAEA